jgi:prolyl-tRNA synthetase
VASCAKCGYAANLEKATSKLEAVEELAASGDGKPELVHTPGVKTIEDLSKFLTLSPKNNMKTIAYMAAVPAKDGDEVHEQPVIAFLRGDHMLNEAKLAGALPEAQIRPMHAEEIQEFFGSPAGFLGPIGLKGRKYRGVQGTVLVDSALKNRKNLVSGANKQDYHLKNVTPEVDFELDHWVDLRNVEAGEGCPKCGEALTVAKAVEIGHIFKLGYKYSESMGARVLDKDGKDVTPIMGSYGIGIERILTAAIEQNHDEQGFWLPVSIAPFEVVISPINVRDEGQMKAAEKIAGELTRRGIDVILDDRDERPGVKFKDADLVGIPFRINVGKKVTEDLVELFERSTGQKRDVNIAAISTDLEGLIRYSGT